METWKMFWVTIFLAASFGFINSQRIVCSQASVGDVVFLVDASIDPQNTRHVRNFLYTMVNGFNVSRETIRVGLAQYSDAPHSEFLLSTYHHKSEVLRHIRKFPLKPGRPGGTKLGLALQFLLDHHFQEVAGSRAREGVPQVAVVLSSSPSEDPVREPAEAFRGAGILLYAIAIGGRGAAVAALREIASSPAEKFASFLPNFSVLGSLTPKLRKDLCDTLVKAAQPVDRVSPACRDAVLADIVFLVDSSTSIGPQNFQKVKNFLHSVVLGLDISSDQVRVGLAQYNDNIYPAFRLNQYPLKSVVLEHIQNLPYRTGATNTGAALEFIRTNYLTEAAGSRAKDTVPQIVILVTDGESNDEVQEAADRLKEDGVVVYVVGINVQDVQELQKMASEPFEKFLFNTENFNILQDVSGGILQSLCSAAEGTRKEFTQAYADVVFLADTSQNTSQASFQWMRNFISKVVKMLDVGRNKYQIGLAQYGGQGHTEFLLNTYQSQDEVTAHIHEHFVVRGGSRRTGKALRYLHQTFFQEAAGSRFLQGVPQYAVVITSGKSEDEVWDAAQTLREKGVKVISVGLQDFDRRELEGMGTPPLVYEMQSQDGVRQVIQDVNMVIQGIGRSEVRTEAEEATTVTKAEKDTTVACPTAIPADLVFLIEEFSRDRQSNFQQVVSFLKTTVRSLSVFPDVRIGLVFYGEKPRLEFSLDTFQTPAKILEHLDKLTSRGQRRRTKTGAALDFLRNEVFIPEKGSRSKQGVQQIAVVITEGFSQDNVSRPASLLRRAGVTIYAVGTQLASKSEDLEKIASYPPWTHAIPLESFLQLSIVGSKIKNKLCPQTVGGRVSVTGMGYAVQEGCMHVQKADIYFLIDGSGSIKPDDFLEMKVFMNEVIKMFHIGPDRVRFGVVQYSDGINSQFILSQYPSVARLKAAIDGIQQSGGGTMTGQALSVMAQVFADTARRDVPWYLIVITDGQSADPVAEAAEALRRDKVIIYAIGVRDANTAELKEIAKDKMFFVHEFDSLKAIQQEVVQDICSSETCKYKKADIIFLIDGSESISPKDFEKMKGFMKRMVNLSNIGADEIQIGLLQFSSTPQEEFRLNQYSLKIDINRAISDVQQMNDGTRTGKALNFTLIFFDSSRGGRPGVHQYLIVITDGVSQDNVAIPAKAIRDKNIIIFAIGVGEARRSQLLEMTNDPGKVYHGENFESLQNLEKEIFYQVCIPEECNLDLSVAIDISTPTRQDQKKLQGLLPELMQQLALLPNISCSQIHTMFRYLVPGSNGQLIFDSGFEKYSDEIIQKFLAHQAAKSNRMDVNFLQSLGDHAIHLSFAKVKVLLVFTDGLDDDLERLKKTSALLRGKGFSGLLIIGLEGVHKLEELQELEFGRGFAYNQPLSITLPSLPRILLKQLGARGFPGEKGNPGEEGVDGLDGEQGNRGIPGSSGEKGNRGNRVKYEDMLSQVSTGQERGKEGSQIIMRGIPELIVISVALREKKEGVAIREVLVMMGLRGKPETLVLRGQEEGKHHQELLDKRAYRVLGESMVMQEKEAPGVSKDQEDNLVYLVPMDMDIREEKEEREEGREIVRNIDERETSISCLLHTSHRGCARNPGVSKCPVFPTEVVFALDMSNDNSDLDFERMRDILLSLLMKMEISESNCPKGARVAIVSYNNKIDYLIRFSDYRGKPALLQAVRKIRRERSSGSRNLGAAMRFVARHGFKRVRSGLLMRKVAVFFQVGWASDAESVSTATLELSALDITPAVITFTEEHNLPNALVMDGTDRFHLFIWETKSQQDVERLARCVLCYDKCRPAAECRPGTPGPLAVDVDVAFVVDSSHSVGADVYQAALRLVDTTLDNLEVAAQPDVSLHGARVALVTHTTPDFRPGAGRPPVLEAFPLTSYDHRAQMQRLIREAMGHPLQGAPALGHALEWTLEKVLLAAPLPRRAQVLFAIVASETSSWDREKLRTLSLEAKCKGITLFVLALGPGVGTRELAELAGVASTPSEQHLLRLQGISDPELAYARRFTWAFLNLLQSGTNQYPPPELIEECGGPSRGDTRRQSHIKRPPKHQRGVSGFADDLEALEATDFFLEENRTATMTSVTQQEAFENYERNGYATEEKEQEMSAKQKKNGREVNSDTTSGPCLMDPMEGECQDYVLKWYYNMDKRACQQFWYGGCGGNANRFETKEECEVWCVPTPL
ncbi:Collagen alpha-4(VI) chain [Myotis davidii]|uniref:Collagen alpha-4(VI) chain n=1 Tax=Myotis davidii TaxID=225400 RepID=L5LHE5_MYODS|nr:Collagen alpha-4(VI) chain [Myotis davidii]